MLNTREVYFVLKNLETVQNLDELSEFYGYGRSTLRAQKAKGQQPDLAAWVRLWFTLNEVARDTNEVIKTAHIDEKHEYQNGLKDLRNLQNQIWQTIEILAL
ncbi:hypothetical protein [Terasakiella pusilla]|uniref:hypothetical protein n=1 Tax=Terasakiella pusilla TaxID=64973 RepID=UPI003AA9C191